jgi:hypothetical protein
MKKDFVCQEDYDHKIWSALPIIVPGSPWPFHQ